MDLEGKVALLTGAGSGIGRAAALAFAREGAKLVIVDRDAEGAHETVAQVRAGGGTADAVVGDAGTSDGVRAYVDATMGKYGRIDAFLCNAGVRGKIAPIFQYEEADFDDIVRSNFKSVFLGLRHVLAVMVEQKHGAVAVTCSTASLNGLASMPGYSGTKHGALGLVRSAAIDVAGYGVRVNAICPGPTMTPLLSSIHALSSDAAAAAARQAAAMPLKRVIEADEIADMALYLCSDRARSITGAYFLIDGGRGVMAGVSTTGAGMTE